MIPCLFVFGFDIDHYVSVRSGLGCNRNVHHPSHCFVDQDLIGMFELLEQLVVPVVLRSIPAKKNERSEHN